MADLDDRLFAIESAIRVDPARRGLLAQGCMLGRGALAAAARHLAARGSDIVLVTGFAIPTNARPVAETDGPPGAALLADLCRQLGMRVRLLTDTVCYDAVVVAARTIGFEPTDVLACPLDRTAAIDWCTRFLERERGLSHLIAIERSGPSHTTTSLEAAAGVALRDNYVLHVPSDSHDRCHNMRGEPIDAHTAPLHLLFEGAKVRTSESPSTGTGAGWHDSRGWHDLREAMVVAERSAAPHTIGIGDGGNEIGMGAFSWSELHPLIAGNLGRRIACRIATDWTIIAGTSNWGAFALAAAVALLRNRSDLLSTWTAARHRDLLEQMVVNGPAVDGVTREPTATVDGLPFLTYIQPWETMRSIAGVPTRNSESMSISSAAAGRKQKDCHRDQRGHRE